jgi:hypothetical protein
MVFFLLKGLKKSEYDVDTRSYDGPTRYHTPLIYGYHDEVLDKWEPKYSYKVIGPRSGKPTTKMIGKGYTKVPVWDNYPGGLYAWLDMLLKKHPEVVWESFAEAGPYPVDRVMLNKYTDGMVRHERRLDHVGDEFSRDSEEAIRSAFPRSWDCYPYGYACPYLEKVCKMPGKLQSIPDGFMPRRPHHEEELKRFEEKGLPIGLPTLDITVRDLLGPDASE